MPKSMRIILAIMTMLIVVLVLSMSGTRYNGPTEIDESKFIFPETTALPTPEDEAIYTIKQKDIFWDSDEHWLAMALEKESGINWPDWAVIMIGDVIMHRVASPAYPGTIKGVLLDPGQYEPFFTPFEPFQPNERYIDLAKRVLNGESYLTDPDILFQALFEQEHVTVLTYYDEVLGTTTYFCK